MMASQQMGHNKLSRLLQNLKKGEQQPFLIFLPEKSGCKLPEVALY